MVSWRHDLSSDDNVTSILKFSKNCLVGRASVKKRRLDQGDLGGGEVEEAMDELVDLVLVSGEGGGNVALVGLGIMAYQNEA